MHLVLRKVTRSIDANFDCLRNKRLAGFFPWRVDNVEWGIEMIRDRLRHSIRSMYWYSALHM